MLPTAGEENKRRMKKICEMMITIMVVMIRMQDWDDAKEDEVKEKEN